MDFNFGFPWLDQSPGSTELNRPYEIYKRKTNYHVNNVTFAFRRFSS
jgi:hypothetical protein